MKKNLFYKVIFSIVLVISCLAIVHDSEAQRKRKKSKSSSSKKDDKEQEKEWKKKLKNIDPLRYKQISEEHALLKAENSSLKKKKSVLENQIEVVQESLTDKENQLSEITEKYNQLRNSKNTEVSGKKTDEEDYTKGIVYKVQIGAFSNPSLKKLQSKGQFWVEEEDGTRKYTIANFRDYWEANIFKKYMRKMGVKDAWIVAYEDNQRKNIKDVLKQ